MNITYQNEWEHTDIHVDFEFPYEEDYQIKMLNNNNLPMLLPVYGSGRNGESRYTYRLENGMSMDKIYEEQEITGREIEGFMQQLGETIEKLHAYLLDQNHILLDPRLIFVRDGKYKFCYLPVRENYDDKTLSQRFHELTEYFVKRLDYKDTKGVLIVSKIHRDTMKENCELKQMIEACREEVREYEKKDSIKTLRKEKKEEQTDNPGCKEGKLTDNVIISLEQEQKDQPLYFKEEQLYVDSPSGPVDKMLRRIKSKRWGQWEDMITEIDGRSMS